MSSFILLPAIPDDSPGASRLLVLACSATKRSDSGYLPALYRYNGPLWQTLRAADPERRKTKVAFLSARHDISECGRPPRKLRCAPHPRPRTAHDRRRHENAMAKAVITAKAGQCRNASRR